jgi:hypothetical protein
MAIPKDNIPHLQPEATQVLNSLKIGGGERAENNGNTPFSQLPEGWNSKTAESSSVAPAPARDVTAPQPIQPAAALAPTREQPQLIQTGTKPELSAQTATSSVASGQNPQDLVTAQVAKQIGKFAETLGISPDDTAEHARIANDLIEKRKFTTKDGLVVSIEMLDKRLDKDPALKAGLEKEFGKGATLESAIPTAEKRDAINEAIKYGEKQNTGIFGGGLLNALMGLLSWAMSGFEGGFAGINDHIATTTANSMAGDVAKHLTNSGKLNKEEIARITDNVRTAALEKGGVKVAKQEAGTAVETTQTTAAPATQPEQQSAGKEAAPAAPATTQAEPTTGKGTPPASATPKVTGKEVENPKPDQNAESSQKPESSHKTGTKEKPPAEKEQQAAQTEKLAKPKEKATPAPKGEPPAKPEATTDNKPVVSNLEKTANRMMDNFLNEPKIKSLNLNADDIKSIKSVVIATLKEKRSDPALSDPSYSGNYKLFASNIADAIVDKTNISKHEMLIETPISDQKNAFAKNLQEFLVKGNGDELRKAALTDKAQKIASIEGIDLQKFGVNATGNAPPIAMRAQQNSAAGAGIA